jgi:hypothetical protein
MQTLSTEEIATLFGTTKDRLDAESLAHIAACDWDFEPLNHKERDATIVNLLERIENRKLTIVANEDKSRWDTGWGENLKAFQESNGDVDALIPKYIRPGEIIRLNGEFVRTSDPNFELNWFKIFSRWFFVTHLSSYDTIFEFGCGSGINVAKLAEMFPEKVIHGLDWAQPSVDIVESLRTLRGMRTQGTSFDFFHPSENFEFPPNSAVITIGAMEQTGTNWQAFLEFLLRKKPSRVHHIEPIFEWYNPSELVDYTALKAHEARNFWRGYPTRLLELEQTGKVKIHHSKRAHFGSLVLEGYSQLIWSPL